jgi:hypothetical protein
MVSCNPLIQQYNVDPISTEEDELEHDIHVYSMNIVFIVGMTA